MKHKTRYLNRRRRHMHNTRKVSIDRACWGKNKPLEQWWNDLSSYLSVIIIYKGSTPYEVLKLQQPLTSAQQFYTQLKPFDDDPRVVAILTSYPNTSHAYETLVYPIARDKTVDYVIMNYDKIFKRVPFHMQQMFTAPLKKLRSPH